MAPGWRQAEDAQPTPCELPGYDLGAQQAPVMTLHQELHQILGDSSFEARIKAQGKAAIAHQERVELATSGAVFFGRSAEASGEERHPLAAPAASQLESALEAGQDAATPVDARGVYFAARDIFEQLGTLADRWPRRARRTQTGAWMRSGVVTETLDAIAAAFERRTGRAEKDHAAAVRALGEAERAMKGGEIDAVQLSRAEDDAVEREEQLEFYLQLYGAARATYALLVGTPWQTSKKIETLRAVHMEIANVKLASVHVPEAVAPSACQRVIMAGGGTEHDPQLAEILVKVKAKYPALTLYTTDYDRGPSDQVARFATANAIQLVRFRLVADHGKAAPFRRNEEMVRAAKPHAVILVGPRAHGPTAHLAELAAATAGCFLWDRRTPEVVKTPLAVA